MNTESIHHLDIGELLAVAAARLPDKDARAHLDACATCRRDAEGWTAVALGVRHLAAAMTPASTAPFDQIRLDSVDRDSPSVLRPGVQPGAWRLRRRRALVATAAAVLVVSGGSYGLSVALGGGGGGGGAGGGGRLTPGARSTTLAAGLTAVNGCATLAGTSGTLEQVNGSDLVIMTSDGQSVPISTSPSTNVGSEASGTLDDISDGAQVVVSGTGSDGTVAATTIGIGAIGTVKMMPPSSLPSGDLKASLAAGTVADAGTGGFTVVEPNGTLVEVTTGSSTAVVTLSDVNVDQLQVGEFTVALGTPTQGGTLAASRIEQGATPSSGLPQPPSKFGMGPSKQNASQPSVQCSASASAAATMALLLAH
jgi:hypothetical protein